MKEFPWQLVWSYNYPEVTGSEAGPVTLEAVSPEVLITETGVCIVWLVGTVAAVREVLAVESSADEDLRTVLATLRDDERIKNRAAAWAPCEVYVTWAFTYQRDCLAIQKFLVKELQPIFGPPSTNNVEPLRVNVPRFLTNSLDED